MLIRVYILGLGKEGFRGSGVEGFMQPRKLRGVLGQGLPHALLPKAVPRLLRDRDAARSEASSA